MAWLALAVDWEGADRTNAIRALTRPEPWHVSIDRGRGTIGDWAIARGAPDVRVPSPAQDDLVVLLEGRLDNEAELRRALDLDPSLSTEAALTRAYRRWGPDLAEQLVGDFALVILDERARTVRAFRDPSGVRPLAYHIDGPRLTIASDPMQLVRLPGVDRTVDADTVVEHLLRRGTSLERTFFRAIKRVPPGHRLDARAGSIALETFVRPPGEDPRLDRPEVVLEEVRHRLLDGVRARARGPRPIAAYLSGGIDSSVIVCAAAELADKGEIEPLDCTLSARYPSLPIDEGPFIALVTARTRIPSVEWNGTLQHEVPAAIFDAPEPPFLAAAPGSESLEWSTITERQIRVVLDGVGGDEVGSFPGVMDDLGRRRRWSTGGARLIERGIDWELRRRRAWALVRGMLASSLPAVHRSARSLRARSSRPPRWLTDQARKLARDSIDRGWTGGGSFTSAAQGWLWGRITAPVFVDTLERLHRRGTFMGVDRRYPFLDRGVVDTVLRVPLEYRLRYPYRRLQQSAMASSLPPEIANRETKANFDGSIARRVRAAAPLIRQVLDEGPWLAGAYVDREQVRQAARRILDAPEGGVREYESVSKITALELWLRRLS